MMNWKIFVICLLAIYFLLLSIFPKDAFWITDNELKFIMLENFSRKHLKDFSIDYAGIEIDKELKFQPLPLGFSIVLNKKLYSTYLVFFSIISIPFFKLFGYFGLYIIPILSTITVAFIVYRILKVLSCQNIYAVLSIIIIGLSTPFFFYSLTFWEHTLASALFIFVVYLLLQNVEKVKNESHFRYLGIGAICGLSVWIREELYLICIAIVLSDLIINRSFKRSLLLALGMIVAFIPLWLIQYSILGNPFGVHISGVFSVDLLDIQNPYITFISDRIKVFYILIIQSNVNYYISLLFFLPYLLFLIISLSISNGKNINFLLNLAGFGILVSTILVWSFNIKDDNRLLNIMNVNGLFSVTPFVVFSFFKSDDKRIKFLIFVILIFIILILITAPLFSVSGIHWGPRFLIVIYPILVILALYRLSSLETRNLMDSKIKAFRLIFWLLVFVSFILQIYSVELLYEKKIASKEIVKQVENIKEKDIITNIRWFPQMMAPVYYNKRLYLVQNQDEFFELINLLRKNGITEFALVSKNKIYIDSTNIKGVDVINLNKSKLKFLDMVLIRFRCI